MRTAAAGFTLLELMVAMTLMGLVFALAVGGLRFGAVAWEKGSAATDRTVELQTMQNLLRRLISSTYPIRPFKDEDADRIGFEGDGQSLRFLGPPPARAMDRAIYLHGLRLAEYPDGRALVLDWRNFPPDAASLRLREGVETEILMRGVDRLGIDYYGPDGNRGSAWRTRWDDQSTLPLLVRISVFFAPRDARTWPPLIVALKGVAR